MIYISIKIIRKHDEIKDDLINEQVILIKEMNHRIKNNINLLTNIIDMDKILYNNDNNVNEVLNNLRAKAFLISSLHEKIYKFLNFKNIDFNSYLKDVINESNKLNGDITIEYNMEDIKLTSKVAINIALIIQELFLNATKYAFGNQKNKIFKIILYRKDNILSLILKDNGTGFNINKLNEAESFGLEMIKSIAIQYGSTLDIKSNTDGTTIKLNLKIWST